MPHKAAEVSVESDNQRALVELSMSGDRDALDRLCRRWYARWRQFTIRHTDSVDIAADVLQDAALQMVKNIHRLRDPDTFTAWSFVILRRSCATQIRKTVRRREHDRMLPRVDSAAAATPDDPRLAPLSEAVSALTTDQQNLLTLFYGYGLGVKDIGAIYEIAPGTVKSRLFKLRESLKRELTQQEEKTDESPGSTTARSSVHAR